MLSWGVVRVGRAWAPRRLRDHGLLSTAAVLALLALPSLPMSSKVRPTTNPTPTTTQPPRLEIGNDLLSYLDLHSILPILTTSAATTMVTSYVYGWYRLSRDADVLFGLSGYTWGPFVAATISASTLLLTPFTCLFLLWETTEKWHLGATSAVGEGLFAGFHPVLSYALTLLPLILVIAGAVAASIRRKCFRTNEDRGRVWDAVRSWAPLVLGEEEGVTEGRYAAPWLFRCRWSYRSGLIAVVFVEILVLCWAGGRLVWQLGSLSNAHSGLHFALLATLVLFAILGAQALALLLLVLGAVRKRHRLLLPYLALQSLSLGPLVAILSDSASNSTLISDTHSPLHLAFSAGILVFLLLKTAFVATVVGAHWEFREEERSWDMHAVVAESTLRRADIDEKVPEGEVEEGEGKRTWGERLECRSVERSKDGKVVLRMDPTHFHSLLNLFQRAGDRVSASHSPLSSSPVP